MNRNLLLSITLGAFCSGFVLAHGDATGVVKERMDAMSDMGDKSKLVADMYKGKTDFDASAVVAAADAFVEHSAGMSDLFPDSKASRSGSDTEALPVIWDNWDEFSKKATQFATSSKVLQEVVASTSDQGELKKAFFKTIKKLFRLPQTLSQTKKINASIGHEIQIRTTGNQHKRSRRAAFDGSGYACGFTGTVSY